MKSFLQAAGVSLALLLSVPSAVAQFVPTPTDLTTTTGYLDLPVRWKEVPLGTCELRAGVKSYSGYVDIAEDQHIFFWFFESRTISPEDADLTVWINGGPGSSSMIGLFQELGPCGIDKNGAVYDNPYSWNTASNLLVIDHPAQVGFSYSKAVPGYYNNNAQLVQLADEICPNKGIPGSCGTFSADNTTANEVNSTASAAPSMWKTLQGFMGAFPQYSRGDFIFATESYGGHYGPIFNQYLQSQNALIDCGELPGAHHIDLRALLIGNGWYDPLIQYAAYYNFSVYPGNTYDLSPYNKTIQDQVYNAMYGPGQCYDQTLACHTGGSNSVCIAADILCASEVEFALDQYAQRDEYDIRELQPDPFPYGFFQDYLNTEVVQKAVGAFTNYSASSSTVGIDFGKTGDDNREAGTVEAVRELLAQGIYVIMYAGDADYNCNWLGGEAVAENVDAPGFASAGYTNITTSDNIVHGQVKQAGNFAFARIYESGHEVPFYQPLVSLELFHRAIAGLDIATGEVLYTPDYKTVGTPKSTYREGNGTVQFEVLPWDATYNTTTNEPNPGSGSMGSDGKERKRTKRAFKPSYLPKVE